MNDELSAVLDRSLNDFYTEHPVCFHPFLFHERQVLLASSAPLAAVDNNTFALFVEILSPHPGFDRSDIPQKRYYDYICAQIYYFFTHEDYKKEQYDAQMLHATLITGTAVAVSQQTGWNPVLVTTAVMLVVNTTLKVGIRAWCRYYADRHPEVTK